MSIETQYILLIICDRKIEEIMQLCLEIIPNYKIVTVNSGVQAFKIASTEKIDFILFDLDQQTSDISWSELISNFKKNPQTNSIPLIALSSTPHSQVLSKLQEITNFRKIFKSFDLSNLANQLSILLD